MTMKSIDLRSDTVTLPTPEMRRAMYEAEVGDDVYREDPTVNRLEERAAELLGKEAALFVPTGTMGNQVAVLTHTRRGEEVIVEAESHVYLYEVGGIRTCEIGTVMFGRQPDGTEQAAALDLVRLAIPRRTYTQSHMDYVVEVCRHVADHAGELAGLRIVEEPPTLRHFTATFEPLGASST